MCEADAASNSTECLTWEQRTLELTVVLSFYGSVGFVGNLLILTVYNRRKSRLSYSPYICTLATVDIIVCCVIIPYTIAFERHLIYYDIICRGVEILRHTLVSVSSLTLCVIAVERYFSVFKPMSQHPKKKARMIITIVFVYSFIVALPSVTIFTVTTKPDDNTHDHYVNTTEVTSLTAHAYCQFTKNIVNELWALSYQLLLASEFFISVGVIVIVYAKVYLEIWRRAKWRRKISAAGSSRQVDSVKSKDQESNPSLSCERQVVFSTKCTQLSPPSGPYTRPIKLTFLENNAGDGTHKGVNPEDNRKHLQVVSVALPLENGVTAGQGHRMKVNGLETEVPPFGMCTLQVPHTTNIRHDRQAAATLHNGTTKASNRVRFVGGDAVDHNNDGDTATTTAGSSVIPTRNGTRNSGSVTSRQNNQRKAGTMLFICTLIYILTWLPFWIDVFGLTDNLVFRCTFLMCHMTNPLVYGIVNTKVREEVKRVLLCR